MMRAIAQREIFDHCLPLLIGDSRVTKMLIRNYDAYVAMYHDQAHIPVKVLAFMSASAVAIGVPINWATVDHGCALDVAWKGVADPTALIETIKLVSGRTVYSYRPGQSPSASSGDPGS